MNTLASNTTSIKYLKFNNKIHIHLTSDDILVIPYSYTRKLNDASKEQLKNYYLIGGGIGVHFIEIDEDISLNGVIHYKMKHELVAS